MGKIVDFNQIREEKIPEGQYCDGCPYYEYIGTDYLLRDLKMKDKIKEFYLNKEDRWIKCPESSGCTSSCIKEGVPTCCVQRVRCNYMKYQDDHEDTLLWDKVKECGIND